MLSSWSWRPLVPAEVAAEAGVSRGLLFHYFPTKTDYHRAVVEAARRRVGRNVSPDAGVVGEAAVRQVVERFLDQVARRRASSSSGLPAGARAGPIDRARRQVRQIGLEPPFGGTATPSGLIDSGAGRHRTSSFTVTFDPPAG